MPITFQQSLDEIAQLVKQFNTNRAAYLAPGFKEAQARQALIDPLFIALGWDVHNSEHAAPDYQFVLVEETRPAAGHQRAPDYTFRTGKHDRKFFAEAKKPGIALKSSADAGYQLRSYGWNAKLPLSILTDFDEFAVYNCRRKPLPKDKPNVARLHYYTCDEYADRWREIWDVFSLEAVRAGAFDQFARSGQSERGASTVDADFLETIEGWRKALAQNIELRNQLHEDDLTDAVQRTIDRLVFLRIAEDREIEPYEQLAEIGRGDGVYKRLAALFRKADKKYNSGLFNFDADKRALRLEVDDKVLRAIIGDLYGAYNFRIMPVEILGNVYEQFLGKVIHVTAGGHAKVEEKPEVRKAGGVYYTPSYIVDYIVRNTVGKQVEGKSVKEVAKLRVLDMACGSGSFLLGRLPVPARLAPALVSRARAGEAEESRVRCGPRGARRRLAADDRGEEAHPAEQHLRRRHRPAGGRGHQAEPAAEGAGGREGRERPTVAAGAGRRAGAARPGQEHPVRQQPDRAGLF